MSDDEFEFAVVATFPDGSVLRRYVKDGQYWHEYPLDKMAPAQRLSMKRAAGWVVWQGGEVVPGVAAASRFYAAVERGTAEREAEIAERSERRWI